MHRTKKSDPDFEPDENEYDDEANDSFVSQSGDNKKKKIAHQKTYLVFDSCLKELFKFCLKCDGLLDLSLTKEHQQTGSQLTYAFQCLKGIVSSGNN